MSRDCAWLSIGSVFWDSDEYGGGDCAEYGGGGCDDEAARDGDDGIEEGEADGVVTTLLDIGSDGKLPLGLEIEGLVGEDKLFISIVVGWDFFFPSEIFNFSCFINIALNSFTKCSRQVNYISLAEPDSFLKVY